MLTRKEHEGKGRSLNKIFEEEILELLHTNYGNFLKDIKVSENSNLSKEQTEKLKNKKVLCLFDLYSEVHESELLVITSLKESVSSGPTVSLFLSLDLQNEEVFKESGKEMSLLIDQIGFFWDTYFANYLESKEDLPSDFFYDNWSEIEKLGDSSELQINDDMEKDSMDDRDDESDQDAIDKSGRWDSLSRKREKKINGKLFYKVTRENISLTLIANKLLEKNGF